MSLNWRVASAEMTNNFTITDKPIKLLFIDRVANNNDDKCDSNIIKDNAICDSDKNSSLLFITIE